MLGKEGRIKMQKILRIMKFALLHPEQYTEDYVRKKFGEKDYDLFSQFCIPELAHYIDVIDQKLKLTQDGVREYHRLQSESLQKRFTILMIIITATLAIASIFNIYLMVK